MWDIVLLVQVFVLGPDGEERDKDGELVADADEVTFACQPRYLDSFGFTLPYSDSCFFCARF